MQRVLVLPVQTPRLRHDLQDDPACGVIACWPWTGCPATGVGLALTQFALLCIVEAGYPLATVGTGGDPGHAPARRTYERAGFSPIPVVHYFQALKLKVGRVAQSRPWLRRRRGIGQRGCATGTPAAATASASSQS